MIRFNLLLFFLPFLLFFSACSPDGQKENNRKQNLVMSLGKRITHLDPALAADTASQYVAAAFYDTPLQYQYRRGDYKLEPSMLESMPEISADLQTFTCVLRNDLFFQEGPPFAGLEPEKRKVTSTDLAFSILRLADARLQSPGYWLIRGKIKGLEEFRTRTESAKTDDLTPYDGLCEGLKIIDDRTLVVTLEQPDPRFAYALALPYCSVVSRKAVEFYKDEFADNPLGSGPFRLAEYQKDYSIRMIRNPEYRKEFYANAEKETDRTRPLPLLDEITCYLVKQPLASWLMFLQGELDYFALDGDHFEAVVNRDRTLAPALTERGIRLIQAPELQTNYIGFNFSDPVLGQNENLRRAISLAFDKNLRVQHSGGRFIPAYGPIPPGTPGYHPDDKGPYGEINLTRAKEYLARAGYPEGIDPKTGRPLELAFDQAGSDTFYRQTAELLAGDLKKIGIHLKAEFNTRPRFLQKLAAGQMQLFRLSWTGDYPDGENFLQLFYGPNSGSCNRIFYSDPVYDELYREIATMPDTAERTEKYRKMVHYLTQKCPWIFETYTMAFILAHSWMNSYIPHDFAFNRWKYFSVNPEERIKRKSLFIPISMSDLRDNSKP